MTVKAMAPHSSTLAWKIPWTEEPSGLQSIGLRRVRYNRATSLSLFTFMHWRRKWQPTPVFLPGESQDGAAWWAAISGVAQSRTRLKRLSSSSSSNVLAAYVRKSKSNPGNASRLQNPNTKEQAIKSSQLAFKQQPINIFLLWLL